MPHPSPNSHPAANSAPLATPRRLDALAGVLQIRLRRRPSWSRPQVSPLFCLRERPGWSRRQVQRPIRLPERPGWSLPPAPHFRPFCQILASKQSSITDRVTQATQSFHQLWTTVWTTGEQSKILGDRRPGSGGQPRTVPVITRLRQVRSRIRPPGRHASRPASTGLGPHHPQCLLLLRVLAL